MFTSRHLCNCSYKFSKHLTNRSSKMEPFCKSSESEIEDETLLTDSDDVSEPDSDNDHEPYLTALVLIGSHASGLRPFIAPQELNNYEDNLVSVSQAILKFPSIFLYGKNDYQWSTEPISRKGRYLTKNICRVQAGPTRQTAGLLALYKFSESSYRMKCDK